MISVIIPTLNAQKYLRALLERLKEQVLPKGEQMEILLMDSGSDDRTIEIAEGVAKEWEEQEILLRILPVKREEFDHGGTRNLAWKKAEGEYIFFLTQDALPCDDRYISNMLLLLLSEEGESSANGRNASDGKLRPVVMVSGRQIPYPDANPVERLTRAFNYPAESFLRGREDIARLGIKAYFFSDACAVYRRSFLEEMGGFEEPIPTNEDMLAAARAFARGYRIGYCAKGAVFHSHNFSLRYQYRRNFDVSAFLTMYAGEIESAGTTGEGIRMVLYTEKELLRHGHFLSCVRCVFESAAKFLGNRAGKKYKSMTREQILKRTSNPGYWNRVL